MYIYYMFKPQLMRHWDSLPNTPTPPPILTFYRYLGYPLLLTWMHFVILLSHLYISFSIFLCIKILAVGCGVIKSALIQINYRDYPLNSCDTYTLFSFCPFRIRSNQGETLGVPCVNLKPYNGATQHTYPQISWNRENMLTWITYIGLVL